MKTEIHPKYFNEAKAICGCGATFVIGSTKEKIEVEICSNCHPFYTGKQNVIDAAGKVEKFKARRKSAKTELRSKREKLKAKAKKKKAAPKKK